MRDSAIVTLAIGEPYQSRWSQYCRAGWVAYCEKHGLDLIVVSEPVDRSERGLSRSVAWQKLLVLSQEWAARYRQIVLMDCDIAINHADAPNIIEQVGLEHVGGVLSGAQIHEDLRPILRTKSWPYERAGRQWRDDQNSHYQMHGLGPRPEGIIQTGVLVASPERHRDVFRSVYEGPCPVETTCYEQLPLSHALLTAGLFQSIDTRFNSVFYDTAVVFYPFVFSPENPMYEALVSVAVRIQFNENFFCILPTSASGCDSYRSECVWGSRTSCPHARRPPQGNGQRLRRPRSGGHRREIGLHRFSGSVKQISRLMEAAERPIPIGEVTEDLLSSIPWRHLQAVSTALASDAR